MKTINPDEKSLPGILSKIPKNQPVIMINLLKFRNKAKYADESVFCTGSFTGREAYHTYSETALKMVMKVGGQVFWMGRVYGCLIAPAGEDWDEALLVKYPSIDAFLKMVSMHEYQECIVHRTAALKDSRLIASIE